MRTEMLRTQGLKIYVSLLSKQLLLYNIVVLAPLTNHQYQGRNWAILRGGGGAGLFVIGRMRYMALVEV